MEKTISVKTDLFKFISLRSPQLIDPVKRDFISVEHPDPSKSYFLKNINDQVLTSARKDLSERKEKYKKALRPRDIQAAYPKLYRFGYWLFKNKKSLNISRLKEEADKVSPLPKKEIVLIWDQLFYELLSKKKPAVRQVCTSILIANHFVNYSRKEDLLDYAKLFYESHPNIQKDDEYLNKFLKRLANSKILVPKAFSANKNKQHVHVPTKIPTQRTNEPQKPKYNKEYLKTANENARALYRHRTLTGFKDDIKKNLIVDGLRGRRIKDALKSKEANFTDNTRAFLSSFQHTEQTLFDIYKKINNGIMSANATYRDTTQKLMHLSQEKIDSYCYFVRLSEKAGYNQLTISIKMPEKDVFIGRNSIEISINKKLLKGDLTLAILDNNTSIKTYQIRLTEKITVGPGILIHVGGKLVLTNREIITLNAELSQSELTYSSCAEVKDPPITEDTDDVDDSPELYGVNHIGMGIFRRVEQEVCCYIPGEVSHIENIMAREFKERSTRNFTSTEDTFEEASETQIETSSDTSTTTRNEMHQAVVEVLNKNLSIGVGGAVGVEGGTGNGSYSANANFGMAMANAASTSDTEAQIFAEGITRSAAEKVVKKSTQKRTSKIIKEFEEKIRHGYDNRDGDEHVTGIYRWIDIIYTNRLINYGNMEMVEFLIPEPSRFYKETILGKKEDPNVPGDTPPPTDPDALNSLEQKGINGPEDILAYRLPNNKPSSKHYQALASYYGVVIDNHPPIKTISENIVLSDANLDQHDSHTKSGTEYIEAEYELKSISLSGQFEYNPGNANNDTIFSITVAGKNWLHKIQTNNSGTGTRRFEIPNSKDTRFAFKQYVSGNIEAVLITHRAVSYNVNVNLIAEITDEALLDWQTEVYQLLTNAFQDYEKEQNDLAKEGEMKEEEQFDKLATGNTAMNRRIEIRELKRSAIEMITRPFGNTIGADFIKYDDCDVPYPDQELTWEEYASHVKFFEQAFEWEIMAYLFYPYFWADRCDWKDLLKAENSMDQIFESFLQSGMARVVVPVRRGFERAVNYYLETGEIWNGGDLVLDTDDDLYLSIDEELEEPKSYIEEVWETRVPSSLTLIQGDSAFLKGEGLPCCHDDEAQEAKIEKSTALLGVIKE